MFGIVPRKKNEEAVYPVPRLREEFKTLFDRFFHEWPMPFEVVPEMKRFWSLEVNDLDKEVVVRAEIPGFEPNDLDVRVRNNRLVIKAEKKVETEEKEKGIEYSERVYERYVDLPEAIDPTKVEAVYRNGVLEVHLPKTEEVKSLKIPVK